MSTLEGRGATKYLRSILTEGRSAPPGSSSPLARWTSSLKEGLLCGQWPGASTPVTARPCHDCCPIDFSGYSPARDIANDHSRVELHTAVFKSTFHELLQTPCALVRQSDQTTVALLQDRAERFGVCGDAYFRRQALGSCHRCREFLCPGSG